MTLGLFAPLFLAGAALIAAPFLIHQIRRPERKPVPFSSLMFVPDVKLEVIERRRVQHILLMLLRMACLLLLCFAFSRPYQRTPLVQGAAPDSAGHHVILLDRSYSLEAGGAFGRAQEAARSIAAGLPAGDRVGVIAFDERPETLTPLYRVDDGEAGSAERAQDAVATAQITARPTDYAAALQAAEAMLRSASEGREAEAIRQTVHVISDFQRSGMPAAATDWRLPASIDVETVSVGAALPNVAVEELAVQEPDEGPLRIRARVRNWGTEAVAAPVSLTVGETPGESQMLTIEPGSAMQAVFTAAKPEQGGVTGSVTAGAGGALAADDVRYFAWNPRDPNRVALVGRRGEANRPSAADFIAIALDGASRDLAVDPVAPEELAARLASAPPGLTVLTDLSAMDGVALEAVDAYVRGGGRALIVLEAAEDFGAAGAAFLEGLTIRREGLRFDGIRESRFDLFASIALDHPIFLPFRGAQFNDFSSLRFQNYHRVSGGPDTAVLAAFEGGEDEQPAMIEGTRGAGRWILWTFPLDSAWTNFPKSPRFLPIVLETAEHLAPPAETWRPIAVGEPLAAAPRSGADWQASMPGSEAPVALASRPSAETAGFARLFSGTTERFVAVNPDTAESDLTPVPEAEFLIRLASAPIAAQTAADGSVSEAGSGAGDSVVDYEYGRWLIAVLAALLAAESLYAARLAGARTQESVS